MEAGRFEFGENWRSYLSHLDEARIAVAEDSLREQLGEIAGRTFLDVGSGSGLFSLAAHRLGARVVSFDYDPSSVWCTEELRRRYRPGAEDWRICQGSALDEQFMGSLGEFEIVYSWGVLHHTGRMWDALDLTCRRVAVDGRLFIALYNDQGRSSKYWKAIKRLYNALPESLRPAIVVLVLARWVPSLAFGDLANRQNPLARYRDYGSNRGMSVWHDWVDWIGGYPFEVARPGDVFAFLRKRGLDMLAMNTVSSLGCNEYVARRK
jgi:2-polyprenyl-3-methyl-5-hydroxy-6-metoxy-1,4-benzoquinol methylase